MQSNTKVHSLSVNKAYELSQRITNTVHQVTTMLATSKNVAGAQAIMKVLGPLFFLIYINDLTEGIKSNIKLFADDTSLSIEVDDPVQGAEVLNRDLEKVKDWANQWLVNFSVEKTKLMTWSFRSINHPDIVFDGMALPETSTHKHLGLTFNSDLSWSSHIKSILDSVSPMTDVLKKLKYKVDKESLEKIYFSFIGQN